jgi:fibro-slime domain-containing protein
MENAATVVVVLAVAVFSSAGLGCGSSHAASQPGFDWGKPGDGGQSGSVGSTGSSGSSGRSTSSPTSLKNPDAGASSSSGDGGCAMNQLTGRLRDFVNKPGFTPASALDDDFENENGDDRGMVETDLGSDQKPVYAHGNNDTATTHGQTQFDWWYRDTPGKNIPFDYTIPLTPVAGSPGILTYDNQEFFPLDGRGWDDEYIADDGQLHNFSFTFELHTTFVYKAGDVFTFIGDDDVFVFIDRKLVVDLGGVHSAETKSITLGTLVTDDATATPVPLTVGSTYPLDIFYNERHTVSSHFRMETSISFNNCTPIVIPH